MSVVLTGNTTKPPKIAPVPDGFTSQPCVNSITRRRNCHRHMLKPCVPVDPCPTEPTCLERLAMLRNAMTAMALGRPKQMFSGGKQITMSWDKECLKEQLYEAECECGKYMKNKSQGTATMGCSCGERCGCGQSVYGGWGGYQRGHL